MLAITSKLSLKRVVQSSTHILNDLSLSRKALDRYCPRRDLSQHVRLRDDPDQSFDVTRSRAVRDEPVPASAQLDRLGEGGGPTEEAGERAAAKHAADPVPAAPLHAADPLDAPLRSGDVSAELVGLHPAYVAGGDIATTSPKEPLEVGYREVRPSRVMR